MKKSIIISLGVVALSFYGYQSYSHEGLCENNLRLIGHAKGVWAVKNKKMGGKPVDDDGVFEYIEGGKPMCPDGGEYTLNAVDVYPICSHKKAKFKAQVKTNLWWSLGVGVIVAFIAFLIKKRKTYPTSKPSENKAEE